MTVPTARAGKALLRWGPNPDTEEGRNFAWRVNEALAEARAEGVAAGVRYAYHHGQPPPNDPCDPCAAAVAIILAADGGSGA